MVTRVAVFADWQNCYNWARRAFHTAADPSWCGQIHPRDFADMLVGKGPAGRTLNYVGMYTGRPDPRQDPRTSGAHLRQCAAWEAECGGLIEDGGLLNLRTRTLRYPHDWQKLRLKPQEKGIDVQFAIDAMLMATRGDYETAILATADTDLLPVAEGLIALRDSGGPAVEVIGWGGASAKLALDASVPVRWIGLLDYRAIQDKADYNVPTSDRRPPR